MKKLRKLDATSNEIATLTEKACRASTPEERRQIQMAEAWYEVGAICGAEYRAARKILERCNPCAPYTESVNHDDCTFL